MSCAIDQMAVEFTTQHLTQPHRWITAIKSHWIKCHYPKELEDYLLNIPGPAHTPVCMSLSPTSLEWQFYTHTHEHSWSAANVHWSDRVYVAGDSLMGATVPNLYSVCVGAIAGLLLSNIQEFSLTVSGCLASEGEKNRWERCTVEGTPLASCHDNGETIQSLHLLPHCWSYKLI